MTPEMARLVRETVDTGEYATVGELVRDALRAWQRERAEHATRLGTIRARVRRSLDDPRPSLSEAEADADLEAMFAAVDKDFDRAAP